MKSVAVVFVGVWNSKSHFVHHCLIAHQISPLIALMLWFVEPAVLYHPDCLVCRCYPGFGKSLQGTVGG